MIELNVPGCAVAKARPRVTRNGTFTPKKTKEYEAYVAKILSAHMKALKIDPLEGALRLRLFIYRPIPSGWSKSKKLYAKDGMMRPTTKPDIDNEAKSIMDAMNGICMRDDAQIVELQIQRHFTDGVPFVSLQLQRLCEGSN